MTSAKRNTKMDTAGPRRFSMQTKSSGSLRRNLQSSVCLGTAFFLVIATALLCASPGLAEDCTTEASTYTFTSFDVSIPGVAVSSSRAHGINALGQIVGRYIDSNENHH